MSLSGLSRPFPFRLALHWAGRYALIWLLLGGLISLVQAILSGFLHDRGDLVDMLKLLDKAPKIFRAFIGGDDLMPTNILSIVAIGYQHPTVLLSLMMNAVVVPTGLLTAQAERGTMEILLSRPITRSRVYAITVALSAISQVFLVGLVFLGTAVWTRFFDYGEEVPLLGFFHLALNLAALSLAVVGLALLVSAFSTERNKAIGILVGYLIGSYLLDFSAVWLPRLEAYHPFSLFYYCRANTVLNEGVFPLYNIGMLLGVGVVATFAGWFIWRRRDLFAA